MRRATAGALLAALLGLSLVAGSGADPSQVSIAWRPLQRGVEYATLRIDSAPLAGDGNLHVVRIDPARAELRLGMSSELGEAARTAHDWCSRLHLIAAINMGMFRADGRTNVGYARSGAHRNNASWAGAYRSAIAFGPRKAGLSRAVVVDLDRMSDRQRLTGYDQVVQNLRLIRAPGKNVWSSQGSRWSEAAIAADDQGRILFLFTRSPLAMRELNLRLLALPLGIRRAMHVEGGPEASLSIHGGGLDVDLNGSYETGFNENDKTGAQWPIPNVVGVVAGSAAP